QGILEESSQNHSLTQPPALRIAILYPHTSHGDGRQEVTSRTGRSGARCRNSIASCADEQPHIGNYRLLKTIGKGNFAKVKLARHILTGREFVTAQLCPCALALVNLLTSESRLLHWRR
uniref:Microtubule affinity regulating kinase 3 n=1 Tax=Suricata suricatta TaxID=37032 RepID=A0A673V0Z5_SURSU